MDPTGGLGFILFFIVVAIIGCGWLFLPTVWAGTITAVLGIGFFALMCYVFSNARFT